ncbi:MAG: hypothetical protein EBT80_00545 [Chitinophagales bacterium]|nr:hypothetical protein [Chitinophagales bacterium]
MEPFNTRYKATFTLNIAQMIEVEKALRARWIQLLGIETGVMNPETDQIVWCREVLDMLSVVVDEGVLAYEAEVAKDEARALDDLDALKKFLDG